MLRIFSSARRDQSSPSGYGSVGSYRLSAKTITGAGEVEPIPGFLYCNGATVSRAKYKRLFDLIGTAYNTGGEAGTDFRLPDFRGRFLTGQTDGASGADRVIGLAVGAVDGVEAYGLVAADVPTHQHGKGTLAVSVAGGAAQHDASSLSINTSNTLASNMNSQAQDSGAPSSAAGNTLGSSSTDSHSHPSLTGAVGDGSADGLAGAAHQNVHPHQAIGGVLVAY